MSRRSLWKTPVSNAALLAVIGFLYIRTLRRANRAEKA